MISLLNYLCSILKCEPEELPDLIRQHPHKVGEQLEKVPLYYSPLSGSGDQLTPVKLDGVTKAGVNTLYACGGHLGITVEQAYYLRHGRSFRFPKLQCIIQRQGDFGGEIYVPIEVAKVDQKK